MKYNDWCAVIVLHGGKKDVWSYVTFTGGLKLHQFLTAEKAETVLKGLRSTPWKEKYIVERNKEIWRFAP